MRTLLWLCPALPFLLLAGCATPPVSEPPAPAVVDIAVPGPTEDGGVRLPNQWYLRPAGKQLLLGDFPVNIAVHPGGKFIAVLHSGYGRNEIILLEVAKDRVVSRIGVDESFYGLAFSADGSTLLCSGAGSEVIHAFTFVDGYASSHRELKIAEPRERAIPAGLAITAAGDRIYVANVWGHSVTVIEAAKAVADIPLGTNTSRVARKDPPPAGDEDEAAITKRAEAWLEQTTAADPFPYACVLDEKRSRLYVSLWAQSSVAVIDTTTLKPIARWAAEEHPNEMLLAKDGKRLFVANANRNTVTVLDPENGGTLETLYAQLKPDAEPGSTPNSVAESPDGKHLFIANANINGVAVFDITTPGKSRSLGFIPVGWYPTSVRVTTDGKHLLVANGKGIISKSNRGGPQPGRTPPAGINEYIAGILQGTLSVIPIGTGEKFEEQMRKHTAQMYRCLPLSTPVGVNEDLSRNPIPRSVGQPSPIQYVIYVIKENRTYDQILGDLHGANGEPSLCLFPERITPNHHALAREFVTLDNFYVESEVSADGHEWTMGAYATDFVEKTWPLSYGHNKHKKFPYPAEGNFDIARPAGGYLWDRAREAGVSYRSYGEFVRNGKTVKDPGVARVSALRDHFDPWYRGFDMDYRDVDRAGRFISELHRFEQEGDMPRLQVVRLSNDHTSGTASNKFTPTAAVADNDLGLGRLVEAVSHSKFWPRTAIFVVEDDAQNGPDHVDAHRTIAYAISPYTRRGIVDSTMYSTASMLRTMELILGLRPMSQFDAAAMPMFASFSPQPDLRPYKARPANVDLDERNKKTAWGSKLSNRMNFAREDAADDLLLNEIIWRSVKGDGHPMPAPTRAAFVFQSKTDDDDD